MSKLSQEDILKVLSNQDELNNYITYAGNHYSQECKTSLEDYVHHAKPTNDTRLTKEDYSKIVSRFNDLYDDFQESIEDRINALAEDSVSTLDLKSFPSIKTKEQYSQAVQFVESSVKKSLNKNLLGKDTESVVFPNFLTLRERLALVVKSVKLANHTIADTMNIKKESRSLYGNIERGLQVNNDQSRALGTGMADLYARVPQGRGGSDGHLGNVGNSSEESRQGGGTEGRGDRGTLREEQSTSNDIQHTGVDAVAHSQTSIRGEDSERATNLHKQVVGGLVETIPTLTIKYKDTLKLLNDLRSRLNGNIENLPKINVSTASGVTLCDFDRLSNADRKGVAKNATSQQKVVFTCASQFAVNVDGIEVNYSFTHRLGTGNQGIFDKLNLIANNPQHELSEITKNKVLPYLQTCKKIEALSKECQSLRDRIHLLQEELSNQVVAQEENLSIEYVCSQITRSNEDKTNIYYAISESNDREDALRQYYIENDTDIESEVLDEGIAIDGVTYPWSEILAEIDRQIQENVYITDVQESTIEEKSIEIVETTEKFEGSLPFKVNDVIPMIDGFDYKPFVIESISEDEVTLRDLEFSYANLSKCSVGYVKSCYNDVIKVNPNYDFSLKKYEENHGLKSLDRINYNGEEYRVRGIDEDTNFCWCQAEHGSVTFLNIAQAVELKKQSIDKWKGITKRGNDVIGNAVFKYIPQKQYAKLNTDVALEIAKQLEKRVNYSGKVNKDNTITLTVSKEDWDTFIAVKNSIENHSSVKEDAPTVNQDATALSDSIESQTIDTPVLEDVATIVSALQKDGSVEFKTPPKNKSIIENARDYQYLNDTQRIKLDDGTKSYVLVANVKNNGKNIEDAVIINFGSDIKRVESEVASMLSNGYTYIQKEPTHIVQEPTEDTPIVESIKKSNRKSSRSKKLTASELYEKFYKVDNVQPIKPIHEEALTGDRVTFHKGTETIENKSALDRYNDNVNAIKTLREVEKEHRYATPQEQEVMSKYAGWGGVAQAFDTTQKDSSWQSRSIELKSFLTDEEYQSAIQSTNTSFYTSPEIVTAMYNALEKFGFDGGNVLEPSMATGNFFASMPQSLRESSKLYGVEIDDISGRIAKLLHPDVNVKITGFENTAYSNNSFDVAIGNVPFGNFSVSDTEYNKNSFLIHDYFFAKAIDKVKPTGVVAFVTSSGTMDKENENVRKYIAERCDLVGAIRLPNTAFGNAGTEVVSDIIFLQKRETLTTLEPNWVKTTPFDGDISINSYFEENPNMVLGSPKVVSGRYGNQLTVESNTDTPLAKQLERAIESLKLPNPMKSIEVERKSNAKVISANPNVKNFTYTQVGNDIYYRANEIMVQQQLSGKTLERVIAMNSIRNAMEKLLEAQERNCSDEELQQLQDNLNTIYDNYTNRLGTYINDRSSKSAFKQDVDYNTICALETYSGKDDKDNPVYTKSDIFTQRTVRPTLDVSITNIHDTLQISLNNKGGVDIPYMTEIAQSHLDEHYTADMVVNELSDSILINPLKHDDKDIYSGYETREEYLSGNVREKLKIAESFNQCGDYDRNVAELEKSLPPTILAEDITAQIGATWVDTSDYEKFMKEVLNTINRHDVTRTPSGSYHISNKTLENTLASTSVWGVEQLQSVEIFEKLLNHSTIQIKEVDKSQPRNEKGNYKYVINREATQSANDKADKMKVEFSNWLWQTSERREKYQQRYNELFNSIKGRTYDGSYLTFPSMSADITLKPHQKNAIARAISNGNTLLAHTVGAGKSFEMIATVMEKKRLGLLSKACVTVPNSLVMQMYNEWKRLYPTANVLVATDISTKADREKFVAQSATGNFDAVIISHDSFRSIPMSNEFTTEYINKQIETLENALTERRANGDRISVKDIQTSIKRLKKKLEDIATNKKDDSIAFDKVGFDALVVDEAHVFKNAMITTKMTNVKGVSSKSGSAMANDMAMKCEYLNQKTNYQNVVFATGTPVSNSMTEFYTMQNYLRPDILEKCGIKTFDDWASVFGNTVTQLEPKPAGDGYRLANRFCEFCNVPEMMNQYLQFADVINREQLDIPNLPTLETGKMQVIKASPSQEQLAVVQSLAKRSEKIHSGAVKPTEDNHLKITNEARLLGLDARCLDVNMPLNPNGKVAKCIDKVEEIYNQSKDNVQAVFCDIAINSVDGEGNPRFSVYEHIKDELIKRGIPKEEICLASDAQNPTDKAIMLNQLQNAQKRVVIASTSKMGTGANFQNHLKAIHNLDIPWRPSDYEQRLGRVLRQGNQNKEVGVYQYITEKTFDAYMLNVVATKQKFIGQISNIENGVSKVGRTASDVDELTLTYQEMQSIASGDPKIKEKIQLDIEVSKLKNEQSNHNKTIIQYQRLTDEIPKKLEDTQVQLSKAKTDLETYTTNYSTMQNAPHDGDKKPFQIALNGTEYYDRKSASEVLEPLISKAIYSGNPTQTVGNYCGFALKIEKGNDYLTENPYYDIVLTAKLQHRLSVEVNGDHISGTGAITRLENFAKAEFDKTVSQLSTTVEKLHSDLTNAIEGATKPFEKADLLKQKEERLAELNAYLSRPDNETMSEELEEDVNHSVETKSKVEAIKELKAETLDEPTQKKKSHTR